MSKLASLTLTMSANLPSFNFAISRLMDDGWSINATEKIVFLVDEIDGYDWRSTTDAVSTVMTNLEEHFKNGHRVGLTLVWRDAPETSVDFIVKLNAEVQFILGGEYKQINNNSHFADISWYVTHLAHPLEDDSVQFRTESLLWTEDT